MRGRRRSGGEVSVVPARRSGRAYYRTTSNGLSTGPTVDVPLYSLRGAVISTRSPVEWFYKPLTGPDVHSYKALRGLFGRLFPTRRKTVTKNFQNAQNQVHSKLYMLITAVELSNETDIFLPLPF